MNIQLHEFLRANAFRSKWVRIWQDSDVVAAVGEISLMGCPGFALLGFEALGSPC
jgi:hypothetical protein